MGYPCLRSNGAFFACVERATGHLIVKLPAHRVSELAAAGQALPFAPKIVNVKPSRFGGLERLCAGYDYCAEHGIGAMKVASLPRYKSHEELDAMRALKAAFDPKNILNPGKTVPPVLRL